MQFDSESNGGQSNLTRGAHQGMGSPTQASVHVTASPLGSTQSPLDSGGSSTGAPPVRTLSGSSSSAAAHSSTMFLLSERERKRVEKLFQHVSRPFARLKEEEAEEEEVSTWRSKMRLPS